MKESQPNNELPVSKIVKQDQTHIYKPLALTLDYGLYDHYLKDANLSETEKQAFLNTLWNMVACFVDLGFEVHPLQQACGYKLDLSQLDIIDVVGSEGQQSYKVSSETADQFKQITQKGVSHESD